MKVPITSYIFLAFAVTSLLNSCRQETDDMESPSNAAVTSADAVGRKINLTDHEKFVTENGLKLVASYNYPKPDSNGKFIPNLKVKELITSQHLNQIGLNNQQINNIYQSKMGGLVEGVYINGYKTSPLLFLPPPANNKAYLETGTPTMQSFISNPDQAQVIFSQATVYNGTSVPLGFTKNISYSQGSSVSHTLTLTAGITTSTQFSLGFAPPQVPGLNLGLNGGVNLNLSAQYATTTIKNDQFTVSNAINLNIPSNKKLFVYAVQTIKQGSAHYSVPVIFTGNVSVKRFPLYVTAPASYLQENSSKVQNGVIQYASYLSADIYVKELGINDPIPTLPF